MKSKSFLTTFLVIATVETLTLFVRAGVARTETLPSKQEFGNYLASLPIELSQKQPSQNEQRLRTFIVASLDPSLEQHPAATKPDFGNYLASLPIELSQEQPSENEQRLRSFLVASLDPSLEQHPATTEHNFSGYLASLPASLSSAQSSEAQQNHEYLVALLTQPGQEQSSTNQEQNNLVAFITQPQAEQTSTTEAISGYLASLPPEQVPASPKTNEQFSGYLASLPAQLSSAQPSTNEQNFRDYLVAMLSVPQARSSTVEQNYIYDLPPVEKINLSAAQQNYANYLVALRQEEQSQSPSSPEKPRANNAPVSTQLKILSPQSSAVLDVPAVTVTVQYPLGSQINLLDNDVLVDANLVGGTETNHTTKIVTQTWYGVSLHQGENTITAQIKANGSVKEVTSIKVFVRGTAKQLTLKTVEARIPADGRSTATIQGELLDEKGNRSNQDAVVTLVASAGEFVGADAKPDEDGFQVEAHQGRFTASLRSDLNAQTVRIRAKSNDLEAFTSLQFETNLRSPIVTGVVDFRLGGGGTNFYKSFREFLPADNDNGTQLDFHTAVFATGKIGQWLFTGAYNSDRNLNQNCDGTSGIRYQDRQQFCDRNYPVYGDSSKTENLAPSQDSLYLRFERSAKIPGAESDYAMWGDYDTKEFSRSSQEFTATNRLLHGFKANYNAGDVQVTGFYGDNVQGFQRDTIAPDGTSGYYFLSQRLLIQGSENVSIEEEELLRPGTVLQRQQLIRGTDYDIDYDRGTLLFRQPILRTDVDTNGQVLVRRIVITYQYESKEKDNTIYGGRVQYNISRELNHESWIGASYVKENQGVRDFELYGTDAQFSIGKNAHIIAEYAHSKNNSELMGRVGGSAYRVEAQGEIVKGVEGRAYYRSTDTGFANNATISFVPGQSRYGAEVTGKVAANTNLRFQYDHEDNNGIAPQPLDNFTDLFTPRTQAVPGSRVDNSLTTITAGVQQRIGKSDLTVDWIHRNRQDRIQPNALGGNSDQLRSRLNLPLTDNLTFLAQNELSISNQKDAVYPDRTILGLDWKVAEDLSIRLAQQFYTSGQFDGNSITSLDFVGEHKFGQDTTLTGRYGILGGANGMSTQGAIGLKQGWTITPGLKLDLAYEHIFGDFFGRTAAGVQYAQPFATGQSASSLGFGSGDSYSVGLEYTDNPDFKTSARFEHRSSSGGSNTVISAGAIGKISPALTALFNYQQANSSNQRLIGLGDTVNLKLGLAYRNPKNDKFNALLRYEYRKNPSTIPDTILLGSGTGSQDHTFALETIYAPNWRWEFYGKYALRHSISYLASDLVGASTVNLAQLRTTYRLGYNIDVVGEARWINQPSENHSETGFVIEAGYYLTPNLRLSAGYTIGNVNDRDFSGSRSASGPYLGLTVKLNELFDGFGLQKPLPPQQQESLVKPMAKDSSTSSKLAAALKKKPKTETEQGQISSESSNLLKRLQEEKQ